MPLPGGPQFGTWGSSCMAVPMPWPTYSRTTENPAASATSWTAWLMSERRLPSRMAASPFQRLCSVTASRRRASLGISPTGCVQAESPW